MGTLLEIADELYGREPGEFIAARDALAKALRSDGDTELASQVKALKKPSTAAWVVDLLVRADAEQVQQVVELGAAMREAQEGMDGAQLRELTRQRRALTSAVTARARELAAEHDVRVTDPVAEQVEATLTAAMIDPEAARAVRSGLLVGTLEATGFGPVDAATAVAAPDALGFEPLPDDGAPRRHLRAVPDLPGGASGGSSARAKAGAAEKGRAGGKAAGKEAAGEAESRAERKEREAREAAARALEEAREELAEHEDDVAAAEEERDEAETAVARLEDEASVIEDEREELRRRLAELDDRARHLDADLRGAVKLRKRAERFLADATRRRDEAAERVRRLEQA